VSHKYEFVFLKTMKTGGTSIEMALEPLCRPPGAQIVEKTPAIVTREGIVGRRRTPPPQFKRLLRRTDWFNHMTADQVGDLLGREKWDRYHKMISVRNPFDATLSLFFWRYTFQNRPEPETFDEARRLFNEWVLAAPFDCNYEIAHSGRRFVAETVIRFETMAADTEAAYRRFDPKAEIILPHTKESGTKRKKAPVADYYDRASTEAILKSSAWVFDRFGYSADPADAKRRPSDTPRVTP
jgi:hypothetical protein